MERKVPSKESFQLFNTIPQAFHTLQAIECSQGIKGVQGTHWASAAGTRVRLEWGGGHTLEELLQVHLAQNSASCW